MAERLGVPLCQDTGVPVVYLTIPPDVPLTRSLYDAIADGVRRATRESPAPAQCGRSSDPAQHGRQYRCRDPGDPCETREKFTVTVLPKGAGPRTVSRIAMLLPSQTDQIGGFVVETMLHAEGTPCPPVFLGVGIGGHI